MDKHFHREASLLKNPPFPGASDGSGDELRVLLQAEDPEHREADPGLGARGPQGKPLRFIPLYIESFPNAAHLSYYIYILK